jgi:hypothetical protein
MKSIFKRIAAFFINWYQDWVRYFQIRRIDRISKKLEVKYLEKVKARVALKKDITEYVKNDLKIDARSKFIPLDVRKRAVDAIHNHFKDRMKEHQVSVNYNFQFH